MISRSFHVMRDNKLNQRKIFERLILKYKFHKYLRFEGDEGVKCLITDPKLELEDKV